ncbi:Hypothetical protein, putative [Bodo saltans]|uniref:Uncharacterized protein n=1 Tax=Bodo saltans TaxID=75058 RepID=A0A0S4JTN3_BODSA|nr:Hypothetical protein, putative [Bodo saltans]|eukprot:CUG93600.1 Hypothetical protein, putative [Bodo saltans]
MSCHPSIANFDFASRVEIETRQEELGARNEEYLKTHPELQERLHDIMEAVLFHKPEDPLAFVQEQVKLHGEAQQDHVSAL